MLLGRLRLLHLRRELLRLGLEPLLESHDVLLLVRALTLELLLQVVEAADFLLHEVETGLHIRDSLAVLLLGKDGANQLVNGDCVLVFLVEIELLKNGLIFALLVGKRILVLHNLLVLGLDFLDVGRVRFDFLLHSSEVGRDLNLRLSH